MWGKALRLGAAATTARIKPAAGSAANWALSKFGLPGKAAAKLSLGDRLVGSDSDADEDQASANGEGLPVPIQESIEVAVPIALAYNLATRFEDYPTFLEHISAAEVDGDTVTFDANWAGVSHEVGIEVFDRRENERFDWRSVDGVEHAGTVSFHELAPRLTHIELSIDLEGPGPLQRLSRAVHLPDRAVRAEMHRFKAYAELYEGEDDSEFEPEEEPEPEADEETDEEAEADEETETEEEAPATG
ncbi:MAG: SRPBCC family protein [Solirubrobacterales bacterium]